MDILLVKLFNPELIRAAASSTMGILCLMIVIIAALALAFFRDSPIWAKLAVFVLLFTGVAGFGFAILHQKDKKVLTDNEHPIDISISKPSTQTPASLNVHLDKNHEYKKLHINQTVSPQLKDDTQTKITISQQEVNNNIPRNIKEKIEKNKMEQKTKSVIIPGTSVKFGMSQSEFKNQLKKLDTECEWYTNKKGYLVCKYEETYRGLPSVAEHYFLNGVLSESHYLSYIDWSVDHVGNYSIPGRKESHGERGDKNKANKYCQSSVLKSLVSDLLESFGPTIKPPEQTRDNQNNARWKRDCEGRHEPSCRANATLEKNKYIFDAASQARLVFRNEHYTAESDRDIQFYDPIKFTGTDHQEDNTCLYEFIFSPL